MKGLFVRAKNAVCSEIRDLKEIRQNRKAERTRQYVTCTTSAASPSPELKPRTRRHIVGHKVTAARRKFPNQRSGRYFAAHAWCRK